MSKLQKVAAALLIALLLATSYGLWVTNPAPVQTVRRAHAPGGPGAAPADRALPVIDETPLLTARRPARLAHSPEEQSLAQSAVQIADHDLDLAFTAALVHLEAPPPPLSQE